MADFSKPSHTQNSDEIVNSLNLKIEALAKMSLIDGTWSNVPVGTVAYDLTDNQFKRKTGPESWASVEISLGDDSSLTLDSLTANAIQSNIIQSNSINTDSITLVADPTTNNQTLTAASYKLLKDDVLDLKINSIDIVAGSEGNDFNITIDSAGSNIEGSEDEIGSNTIVKRINLPSASETARGAVTTDVQTFGGEKTFASGTLQLGNNTTASNNWHITSGEKLKILSGNLGSGTERVTVDSTGKIGAGTNAPENSLHLKNTLAGITLEDTSLGAIGTSSITTSSRDLSVDADSINLFNKMCVKPSGHVGIGTSNPQALLHLRSISPRISLETTNGFDTQGIGSIYGTSIGGIVFEADPLNSADNTYIKFDVDGSERIRVTSNGDVGVGTNTPTQRLHVSGSIYSDSALILQNSSPTLYLQDTDHRSCMLRCDNNQFRVLRATGANSTSTDIPLLTIDLVSVPAGTATFAGNVNCATFYSTGTITSGPGGNITSGGNLTVSGSTSVGSDISCGGNLRINNGSPTITLQDLDQRSAFIHVNSNRFYILRGNANSTSWLGEPHPLYIDLGNNNAHFGGSILAGGNVYPNSALTNQSISASTQLESGGSLFLYNAAAGAVVTGTSNTFRNYTDSDGHFLPFVDNAYLLGRWDSFVQRRWNNIYLVGGPTYPSDQRDKFDIQDSALGLNFICSLRPVSYKYKVAENIVEKTGELEESGTAKTTITPREGVRNHYGFIAQEVRQVLNDDTFAGWALLNKDDPESKQALVYTEFISPMVKAIQELNAKISILEQKIIDLESKE